MTLKLTHEQRAALQLSGSPVPVEDELTHELFYLVDQATLERWRQDADRQAIQQGIADLEAGRVLSLDELDARIQSKLRAAPSA